MFLSNDKLDAEKVYKWSAQSSEAVPLSQHEEIGYNYQMSNIVVGLLEGRFHIKKSISLRKSKYMNVTDMV